MSKAYPLKCRITAAAEGEPTRVEVYDDIGDGGWFSEGLTAKSFAAQLGAVTGPLDVHINSYGGEVGDGMAITNTIRAYKGRKRTIVDGMACSAASVIFQAGDERVVEPGAMVMIHDASGLCIGNAGEMAAFAQTLDKISDNIAQQYADRAGGTAGQWREVMRGEQWYNADEAVESGLADRKGTGTAELPAGLDLAAFTGIPGRVAAALRSLPVAKAPAPVRDKAPLPAGTGPSGHGSAPEQTCADLGHQCCQSASPSDLISALAKSLRDEIARQRPADANTMHGDHERWDPDGDGDCDACPEGDTDHDYWTEEGQQIREVPGKPMPAGDRAPTADDIRAIVREEIAAWRNASADDSDWDGPAAMSWASSQDNPESAFRSICAGEKTTGEPDTQAHWALPHHKHAGDPPNSRGVSAALGRLDQTQGLKDKGAAEAHLKAHQAATGGSDDDGADDRAGTGLSGFDPEQFRAALRGATR